jgi:hypothetical protein
MYMDLLHSLARLIYIFSRKRSSAGNLSLFAVLSLLDAKRVQIFPQSDAERVQRKANDIVRAAAQRAHERGAASLCEWGARVTRNSKIHHDEKTLRKGIEVIIQERKMKNQGNTT